MGLAEDIQQAVSNAWPEFDTIRQACVYHSTGTFSYNPITDVDDEVGHTNEDAMVIWAGFKVDEVDGSVVRSTDKKVLIPSIDLTATPKYADYIIDSSDITWAIRGFNRDPARALWVLHVRKSV